MEKVHCDNCGTATLPPEEGILPWGWVAYVDSGDDIQHFCSRECFEEWYNLEFDK